MRFDLYNYISVKLTYLNSVSSSDVNLLKILAYSEIDFILHSLGNCIEPINEFTILFVDGLKSQYIKQESEYYLGAKNINFFLAPCQRGDIKIVGIDYESLESGSSFYIDISFLFNGLLSSLKISEKNILFLGFDKFSNLSNFFNARDILQNKLTLENKIATS